MVKCLKRSEFLTTATLFARLEGLRTISNPLAMGSSDRRVERLLQTINLHPTMPSSHKHAPSTTFLSKKREATQSFSTMMNAAPPSSTHNHMWEGCQCWEKIQTRMDYTDRLILVLAKHLLVVQTL